MKNIKLNLIKNKSFSDNFSFFYFPLLSIVLLTLGSSFFTTFISIKMEMNGVTQFIIGCIHSSYYAGMLVGAILMGGIIRKIGYIYAYVFFASVISVSILLQGYIITAYFWLLMRFIFGFSMAGIYVVIESWLLARSTLINRGSILSVYMILLYAAQVVSHELLHFMELGTFMPFILAAVLCGLSLTPMLMINTPSPVVEIPEHKNFSAVFNVSPDGFMGCLLSGFLMSAIFSFVPNFAVNYHFSVSLLMQTTIAGGCLLQWPIGKLSDQFSRRSVLLAVCNIIFISAFLILLFPAQKNIVYFFSFILGGCSFSLYTLSIALVNDVIKISQIVSVSGFLLFAYSAGSVLGPIIAALFMDFVSIKALYGYMMGISLLMVFINRLLYK